MPRTLTHNVRSGRFDVSADTPIIQLKDSLLYRIHNTSRKEALTIDTLAVTSLEIAPGNSFDIQDRSITVKGSGEGVYDVLGGGSSVRSGRMVSEAKPVTIAYVDENKTVYRFINALEMEFTVQTAIHRDRDFANPSNLIKVAGKSSADVEVDKVWIRIAVTDGTGGTIDGAFEGIYERVSGR